MCSSDLRLLDRHEYSANQILALLKEEGYTGGATILREHVARERPRHRQAFLKLRFAPGQTAHLPEWSPYPHSVWPQSQQ